MYEIGRFYVVNNIQRMSSIEPKCQEIGSPYKKSIVTMFRITKSFVPNPCVNPSSEGKRLEVREYLKSLHAFQAHNEIIKVFV